MPGQHNGIGMLLGAAMLGVGSALYVYSDLVDTTTSLVLIICGALAFILAALGQWRAKK